jgi:hypothetical protein
MEARVHKGCDDDDDRIGSTSFLLRPHFVLWFVAFSLGRNQIVKYYLCDTVFICYGIRPQKFQVKRSEKSSERST